MTGAGQRTKTAEVTLILAAVAVCALTIGPGVVLALKDGASPGDVRSTAQVLGSVYGLDVGQYLGSAPRAMLVLELDALATLPVLIWIALAPRSRQPPVPHDLRVAGLWAVSMVLMGHASVASIMLVTSPSGLVWSWTWRLAFGALLSATAELGLIATLLSLFVKRRGGRSAAFGLWLVAGIGGDMLRVAFPGSGGYVLPTAIDQAVLTGQSWRRAVAAAAALGWLALAFWLARRHVRLSRRRVVAAS
jgi:hypothetical protein